MNLKQQNKENEYDSSKYLKELIKVKTRGLSEFYFSDNENQDIHDFDGNSDNLEYEYGARVEEKLDDNIYICEIKNKLSLKDKLEVLPPNNLNEMSFEITKLWDVDTLEEIDTINPGKKGQLVKIYIPYNLEKGYIIRRKK